MTTTLKAYAEEALNRYSAMKAQTLNRFNQLTSDYAAAVQGHATLTTAHAEQTVQISAKRRAMSGGDLMPSEIEMLAETLRELLRQQRITQGEVLAADEAKNILQGQKQQSEEQLNELKGLVQEAEAVLQQEMARESQLAQWNALLADDVFTDLQSQAMTVLDAADDADEPDEDSPDARAIWLAGQRIVGDIPEPLLTRARERAAVIDERLEASADLLQWMEDKAATQGAVDAGLSGVSAQRWLEFERTEDVYRVTVTQGASRYAHAMSLLAAINSSEVLSSAEIARIADKALAEEAEAVVNEQARDLAQAALYLAQQQVEMALTEAQLAGIDSDPEGEAVVIAARAALASKELQLADAEADYDAAMREAMDEWEGAVPNRIWHNLINYDRAVALLTALGEADIADLASAMESSQSSLVTALQAEEQALRREIALEEAVVRAAGQLDTLSNAHSAQLFSRTRGDI